MAKTVGIVGLGRMGSAMAGNLIAAGFAVVGRDTDPARADALAAMGGQAADSPRAVAEAADCVMTSLPTIAAFEAVTAGPDGIAAAEKPDLVAFDTSTLPIPVKEAGRVALAETGKILLDTPLSGTGKQALTGDLVVYASGDTAAIAGLSDVFEGFSRAQYDLGEFGNGSRMKFVANLLVAIHNVAAGRGLRARPQGGARPGDDLRGDRQQRRHLAHLRNPRPADGRGRLFRRLGVDRHAAQGHEGHRRLPRRAGLRRPLLRGLRARSTTRRWRRGG